MDIKVDELQMPVKSKWGADPFVRYEDRRTGAEEEAYLPEFSIEGIITDGIKPLAIIDGRFYRKGDVIEDFVIEDILSDRIMLRANGKSFTLRIQGFTVQGPAREAGR